MGIFGNTNNQDEEAKKAKKPAKKASSKPAAKKTASKATSMKDLYEGEGKKEAKRDGAARKYDGAYRVILRPLITEKATNLGIENKYAFEVAIDANKLETAKAIEQVYGVRPAAVNIIKMKGKAKNYGRVRGKRKDWKKAVVTLPKGKTIQVYEGV